MGGLGPAAQWAAPGGQKRRRSPHRRRRKFREHSCQTSVVAAAELARAGSPPVPLREPRPAETKAVLDRVVSAGLHVRPLSRAPLSRSTWCERRARRPVQSRRPEPSVAVTATSRGAGYRALRLRTSRCPGYASASGGRFGGLCHVRTKMPLEKFAGLVLWPTPLR